MRWMLLIAMLLVSEGCGENTTLVTAGQPVMILAPVSAHVAHYTGKDQQGNRVWSGDTIEQIPPGWIAEAIPAATAPAPK